MTGFIAVVRKFYFYAVVLFNFIKNKQEKKFALELKFKQNRK